MHSKDRVLPFLVSQLAGRGSLGLFARIPETMNFIVVNMFSNCLSTQSETEYSPS